MRYVGLDQVWGRAGMELHERLIDAPTMAARFSILENFLLSRPWSSARRHPGVAAALAAIEDNPSIRMADIRDLVGMSTKRLIALFRAEVGLSPKAYARIRRFQAALRLLGTGSRRSSRGRCRLFRPGPLRPGIPVFHRHDADAVRRTTDSVAQPRPRRGAGAAQISKTAGRRLAHDGPMDNTKHAVAATGLLVAAMRAEESARDDALFHDPFAERLAGDDGRRLLAESSCGDRAALGADRRPHQGFSTRRCCGRTPTACRRW